MVALASLMYWVRLELHAQRWSAKFHERILISREITMGFTCSIRQWPPGIGVLAW